MKSILKATAVLSSASVVSIIAGIASAKVTAVLLGPAGVGYMGLLQSLLGLAVIVASMGVAPGLVRAGARVIAEADSRKEAALRGGAWLLSWGLGGLGLLVIILLRAPLSRVMLGGPQHTGAVALVGVAMLLMLAAGVQTSILNAHHRVGALARVNMLSTILGVGASLMIIWRWRESGIAWAVLATTIASWLVSNYYTRRQIPALALQPTLRERWAAARSLLRFGGPFTASMLVSAGVQLALPALVLHFMSTNDVGFYRAATAISVNYLGFLITAMAQDYYPRISAVGNQREPLGQLINDQYRLVLLLGGPIILGMLALVPYLVPLIYTVHFAPTVALLEWQLIGDLFRFTAWTMAFVILARNGSLMFFCIELAGGMSLLIFSLLGMRWFGLEGLGVGFLMCTSIYYLLCWTILHRTIGLRWTKQNSLLFLALTLAALIIRVLPYIGLGQVRTPVAILLASLASGYSLYAISKTVGGLKGLLAWRRASMPNDG